MSEPVFFIPVIPTTGAFLIEKLVGDKLDSLIEKFEGKSSAFSKLLDTNMPYKWIKYNERKTPSLTVVYDRKRNSEQPFGLSLTVELASKLEIPEIWTQRLILHFVDKRWRDRYYTFENKPITLGSQAEAFVYNFYKKRKLTNWIQRIPRRHLELTKVTGLERYDWQDPKFFSFLSTTTHGLIFKKKVRKLSKDRFVDEEIMEA